MRHGLRVSWVATLLIIPRKPIQSPSFYPRLWNQFAHGESEKVVPRLPSQSIWDESPESGDEPPKTALTFPLPGAQFAPFRSMIFNQQAPSEL